MYGATIGSLNIYTRSTVRGALKQVGSLSGNYGDAWMRKDITLHEASNFQVVLEGVVGNGYTGDIAVDDISMTPGCVPASSPLPSGSPPPATTANPCAANQFSCDGTRCINQSQICNFVLDCADASDENNCGMCAVDLCIRLCGGIFCCLVLVTFLCDLQAHCSCFSLSFSLYGTVPELSAANSVCTHCDTPSLLLALDVPTVMLSVCCWLWVYPL